MPLYRPWGAGGELYGFSENRGHLIGVLKKDYKGILLLIFRESYYFGVYTPNPLDSTSLPSFPG